MEMSSIQGTSSSLIAPANESNSSGADLLAWVSEVLKEGFSKASKYGSPTLFVRETDFKWGIPYEVIDSGIKDVHFFRSTEGIFLGIGRAKEWQLHSEASLKNMKNTLKLDHESSYQSKVWLLGGWSFPSGRHVQRGGKGFWKSFPYSRWVIPALLFTSINGRNRVVLAAPFDSSTKKGLKEYYGRLMNSAIKSLETESRALPVPMRLKNWPSRKRWISLVSCALESISKGELKKVVLARSIQIVFDGVIPCSAVLRRLMELNPDSTTLAIRIGNTTFLGATPERLLFLKHGEIEADCLAGSAPRDSNTAMDESLGLSLLQERKSRREHQLVVQQVMRSLSTICSEVEVLKKPLLRKLATIQHLQSVVRGLLLPKVDIWSAALSIWPTPATGGVPKEMAVRWIQDSEPINRGWYSGVVGCVDSDGDGNLVVPIRSCIVRGNSAIVFAGSGIVAGSDPNREFEETNWKLETVMNALAVRDS